MQTSEAEIKTKWNIDKVNSQVGFNVKYDWTYSGGDAKKVLTKDEILNDIKLWAKKVYPKLIYFHEVNKGGHFAAWEQPQLFAEELRVAFKSLRY